MIPRGSVSGAVESPPHATRQIANHAPRVDAIRVQLIGGNGTSRLVLQSAMLNLLSSNGVSQAEFQSARRRITSGYETLTLSATNEEFACQPSGPFGYLIGADTLAGSFRSKS